MSRSADAKHRVLIVDDEEDVRAIIGAVLAPSCAVFYARNGLDALVKVPWVEPDLIVADVMMPLVDGVGLCEGLRALRGFENVPVALISAQNEPRSSRAPAAFFLPKPFEPEEIASSVRRHLAARPKRARSVPIEELLAFEELGRAALLRSRTPNPPEATPVPSSAGTRRLLVAAAPDIAESVARAASAMGCEAVAVCDGEDAVRAIPRIQPDAFVLDAMLPRMSGYQIATELRQCASLAPAPILFLTAADIARDAKILGRFGIADIVPRAAAADDLASRAAAIASAAAASRKIFAIGEVDGFPAGEAAAII